MKRYPIIQPGWRLLCSTEEVAPGRVPLCSTLNFARLSLSSSRLFRQKAFNIYTTLIESEGGYSESGSQMKVLSLMGLITVTRK